MKLKIKTKKIEDVEQFFDEQMSMTAVQSCGYLLGSISRMENHTNESITDRIELINNIQDMYIMLMALQIRYGIPMSKIEEGINKKLGTKEPRP